MDCQAWVFGCPPCWYAPWTTAGGGLLPQVGSLGQEVRGYCLAQHRDYISLVDDVGCVWKGKWGCVTLVATLTMTAAMRGGALQHYSCTGDQAIVCITDFKVS
jgi:hypothetical protein